MTLRDIKRLSKEIILKANECNIVISTAESCTGGLIGSALTSISGSSAVYDRGYITYSNESKSDLLNIDIKLIEKYGAVSKEIAILMAEGALKLSNASLTVSVTGVAGPGGGTKINPVGRVYIGIAKENKKTEYFLYTFEDKGRKYIRELTTLMALENIFRNL